MHKSKLIFLLFSFPLLYKRYADLPHWGCVKIKKNIRAFSICIFVCLQLLAWRVEKARYCFFFPLSYYFPNCETAFLPTKFYIVRYRKQSRIFSHLHSATTAQPISPQIENFFFQKWRFPFFFLYFIFEMKSRNEKRRENCIHDPLSYPDFELHESAPPAASFVVKKVHW